MMPAIADKATAATRSSDSDSTALTESDNKKNAARNEIGVRTTSMQSRMNCFHVRERLLTRDDSLILNAES